MRHQREIVDYNVIIFYDCHVGVARRTCTRVTLVAWLITGLRELSKIPRCRFGFGSCSVPFVHPWTFSSLLLPVAACRYAMWSIEIRSSVPF